MEDLSRFISKEVEVELGETFVEGKLTKDSDGDFVLLHNNPTFQGWNDLGLQGYKYRWYLDDLLYTTGSIKLLKQEDEMEETSELDELKTKLDNKNSLLLDMTKKYHKQVVENGKLKKLIKATNSFIADLQEFTSC